MYLHKTHYVRIKKRERESWKKKKSSRDLSLSLLSVLLKTAGVTLLTKRGKKPLTKLTMLFIHRDFKRTVVSTLFVSPLRPFSCIVAQPFSSFLTLGGFSSCS